MKPPQAYARGIRHFFGEIRRPSSAIADFRQRRPKHPPYLPRLSSRFSCEGRASTALRRWSSSNVIVHGYERRRLRRRIKLIVLTRIFFIFLLSCYTIV